MRIAIAFSQRQTLQFSLLQRVASTAFDQEKCVTILRKVDEQIFVEKVASYDEREILTSSAHPIAVS
jgi:hypothetical protein